jgi:hypothetical protein
LWATADSDDFKTVDAAFEKNIAELKKAGAIVDPIVIPPPWIM